MPVLDDEPDADPSDHIHHERQVPGAGCEPGEHAGDHEDTEVPFVDPSAEHVHTRPQSMALKANHSEIRHCLPRAVPSE